MSIHILTDLPDAAITDLSNEVLLAIYAEHVAYEVDPRKCRGCGSYYRAGEWAWPCPTRKRAEAALRQRGHFAGCGG